MSKKSRLSCNEFYLYKITNTKNNKIYIGQTIDPKRRWADHKKQINNHKSTQPLYNSFKIHGIEAFKFEIIEKVYTEDDCNRREQELIIEYDCLAKNGKGYNANIGGDYVPPKEFIDKYKITIDERKFIAEAFKNKSHSCKELAEKFSVSTATIYNYTNTLEINGGFKERNEFTPSKLSNEEKEFVKQAYINGTHTCLELSQLYKVDSAIIRKIIKPIKELGKFKNRKFKNNKKITRIKKSSDFIINLSTGEKIYKSNIINDYINLNITQTELSNKYGLDKKFINVMLNDPNLDDELKTKIELIKNQNLKSTFENLKRDKFTLDQAEKIRIEYLNENTSSIKLAKKYEVDKGAILDILNNVTYISGLSNDILNKISYKLKNGKSVLTVELADEIRNLYLDSYNGSSKLAKKYKVDKTVILNVLNNKSYVGNLSEEKLNLIKEKLKNRK